MSIFTMVVPAGHCVVRYRKGLLVGVLEQGEHRRVWRGRDLSVDLRRGWLHLSMQEIPTSDAVPVRVSASVLLSVTEPVAYLERSEDPRAEVYLATQVALREVLADITVDELVQRRFRLRVADLRAAADRRAGELGLTVHEVVIKDVLLPAEIRAAGLALITARQRGAARLEEARAETAALRAEANAAKLLDEHPALARLKLLQAAPLGSKVVLSLDGVPVDD